jgi:hypothetical protein
LHRSREVTAGSSLPAFLRRSAFLVILFPFFHSQVSTGILFYVLSDLLETFFRRLIPVSNANESVAFGAVAPSARRGVAARRREACCFTAVAFGLQW